MTESWTPDPSDLDLLHESRRELRRDEHWSDIVTMLADIDQPVPAPFGPSSIPSRLSAHITEEPVQRVLDDVDPGVEEFEEPVTRGERWFDRALKGYLVLVVGAIAWGAVSIARAVWGAL